MSASAPPHGGAVMHDSSVTGTITWNCVYPDERLCSASPHLQACGLPCSRSAGGWRFKVITSLWRQLMWELAIQRPWEGMGPWSLSTDLIFSFRSYCPSVLPIAFLALQIVVTSLDRGAWCCWGIRVPACTVGVLHRVDCGESDTRALGMQSLL